MKQRLRFAGRTILLAIIAHAIIAGCGSDDNDDSKESTYLKKLSATWHIERVTLDDADITQMFGDVVLTINSNNTYSVLNGMSPYWPPEGKFRLVAADQPDRYRMIRDDGMEILITNLSSETLQMNLAYNATPSGRVSSMSGDYEFVFERQ